jgi:hypothetical protein
MRAILIDPETKTHLAKSMERAENVSLDLAVPSFASRATVRSSGSPESAQSWLLSAPPGIFTKKSVMPESILALLTICST